MPQLLQSLLGYSAQDAGLVVSLGAALLLVESQIVGFLTTKFPAKYLMAFGWIVLSGGLYLSAKLVSLDIDFKTAAIIMVMQYLPLAFLFIPATTASYIGVPQNKSNSTAGLHRTSRAILAAASEHPLRKLFWCGGRNFTRIGCRHTPASATPVINSY